MVSILVSPAPECDGGRKAARLNGHVARKAPRMAKKQTPAASDEAELQPGYLIDYISGLPVRATPEEVEAVQVFARRLVEDFEYPKDVIITRPQYRVRQRPSGGRQRGYPVDIAVFSQARKLEDDLYIVVECKRKTEKEGEKQLKIYLSMSSATIGVWFNGESHLYLHKKYLPDGTVDWEHLPTIPKWGQPVSAIGSLTRNKLTVPTNLKAVFRDIRNHLAGMTTGITRDQQLAQEIMAILFCKIVDEINTGPRELPKFRVSVGEPAKAVAKRIKGIFESVKTEYDDVFQPQEIISLDDDSLCYIVGELQNYLLIGATRDAIGEAFEVFIGPAVRGEEGQFFTPRNVVQMMIDLLDPDPGQLLLDPACGSGGFLIVALEHVWKKLEQEGVKKGWSPTQVERRRRDIATRCIRGIDKDAFLTKVTKAYMAIIGDGRGGVFCEDSLGEPGHWSEQCQSQIALEKFDLVVTNPPFGSKIKVTGAHKLAQYTLGKIWKPPRKAGQDWEPTNAYKKERPPQILFIERCIQFLKPGGRLAIILPESIFGMPVYGYVVKWLFDKFKLLAFISLPEEVFQPYTHAKTCVVLLEHSPPELHDEIEMAIADWCGHDSRGNPTTRLTESGKQVLLDDIPKIAAQLAQRLKGK
jgi:type I restriction enzyme M protein